MTLQFSPRKLFPMWGQMRDELRAQLQAHRQRKPEFDPASAGECFRSYGEQLLHAYNVLYLRQERRILELLHSVDAAERDTKTVQQTDEGNSRSIGGVF